MTNERIFEYHDLDDFVVDCFRNAPRTPSQTNQAIREHLMQHFEVIPFKEFRDLKEIASRVEKYLAGPRKGPLKIPIGVNGVKVGFATYDIGRVGRDYGRSYD